MRRAPILCSTRQRSGNPTTSLSTATTPAVAVSCELVPRTSWYVYNVLRFGRSSHGGAGVGLRRIVVQLVLVEVEPSCLFEKLMVGYVY